MLDNSYLSTKDAAKYLNYSPAQILRWAGRGYIGTKVGTSSNSEWRFTREELDRFIESYKKGG